MGLSSSLGRVLRRVLGRSVVPPNLDLGARVHIGPDVWIDWSHAHHVHLEDDVVLAPGVRIVAHDAAVRRLGGLTRVAPVVVEQGAFVGAGALLLPGVRIGRGAVVGAGSVVTADVEPGTVCAGNPARRIGLVSDLVDRGRCAVESGIPVLDRAIYNRHSLSQESIEELRRLVGEHGSYYMD